MSRFKDAYNQLEDTALVGGICVDIRKSMSRFEDAYSAAKKSPLSYFLANMK